MDIPKFEIDFRIGDRNMTLSGKDVLCTQDLTKQELDDILNVAKCMKQERFHENWTKLLTNKTFLMFFYNPSVRTHLSFATAVSELGGHAEFFTPHMTRLQSPGQAGETIEDAARVMARYVAGIGIRIAEDKITSYGKGHELLLEYAKWADVPIINMASDRFHPCQGLADIMGWAEWYGNGSGYPNFENLKGKNFLLTWAKGELARGWCSVQESLLVASRFGMNITVAHPEGYDLDPEICNLTQQNCKMNNASYRVIDDPNEGYKGAHVVYSRHWVSPDAYKGGELQKLNEIRKALQFKDWITNTQRMSLTDNAIYTHCMPIDRGNEVTDEVASGPRSAIYDVAENRLHVQKAILALTLSQYRME